MPARRVPAAPEAMTTPCLKTAAANAGRLYSLRYGSRVCRREGWVAAETADRDKVAITTKPASCFGEIIYLLNLFSPKFIEYVLGKGNSLPVYVEAKEPSLWRTVEAQPARYIRRIGNRQLNVEIKVRKCLHGSLALSLLPRATAHKLAFRTNDDVFPLLTDILSTRWVPAARSGESGWRIAERSGDEFISSSQCEH